MSNAKPSRVSDAEEQDFLNRRTFVQAALGGVCACYAGAVGYPVYRYLASPVERAASAAAVTEILLKDGAEKLPPGGPARMFKFGTKPGMLIHHPDGTWVALTAVCTHLGCTVQYNPDKTEIHCACHGGVYDAKSGANVSGPPPKPLTKYSVKVTDAGVLISRT